MKKLSVFALLLSALLLQFCSSSKRAQASVAPAKVTYVANVQPIISASCSPCHIPPQGRSKALNTYEAAKNNIDQIVTRINKAPGDKGFMPMRHPKLPDSTIAVFAQWKTDGLLEN